MHCYKPCAELLLSVLQSGNPALLLWLHALYVSDMDLLKGIVTCDQTQGKSHGRSYVLTDSI